MINSFFKAAVAAFLILSVPYSANAFVYDEDPFAEYFKPRTITELASSTGENAANAYWIAPSILTVDGTNDLDTTIEVGVQTIDKGNGETECQLLMDHPDFKKASPWHPLPMRMNTKKRGANGGVDDAFGKTLSFYDKSSNAKELNFKVDFVKGNFSYFGLWRIQPFKINYDSKDKGTCAPKTEICNDIEAKDGKYICKGEWEWMERISVQINPTKYYIGSANYITGLTGHYHFVEERGGTIVRRDYTEKIK